MTTKRDPARLLADVRAVVLDRRSVLLLLEEQWHNDPLEYWRLLFDCMDDAYPCLARVTVAQSVVRLARTNDDLAPLVERLSQQPDRVSLRALKLLFGMAGADPKQLVYAPWLHACGSIARIASNEILRLCTSLVLCLFDRNRERSADQLAHLSETARKLFAVAWQLKDVDVEIVAGIVQAIIETFDVAADESSVLLESALRAKSHPAWGMVVLWMSRLADQLLARPDLVASVYQTTIDAYATDEAQHDALEEAWYEQARIDEREGRPIAPIPRRQGGTVGREAISALEHRAGAFMQVAPIIATRTLIACIERWLSRNDGRRNKPVAKTTLTLFGRSFEFAHRFAFVSPNVFPGDFCSAIISRLDKADDEEFEQLVDVLVQAPAPGPVWSELIGAARFNTRLFTAVREWFSEPAALREFPEPFSLLLRAKRPLVPEDEAAIRSSLGKLDENTYARLKLEEALTGDSSESDFPEDAIVTISGGADEYYLRTQLLLSPDEIQEPNNARLISLHHQAEALERNLSADPGSQRSAGSAQSDEALKLIEDLQLAIANVLPAKLITYGWCSLAGLASATAVRFENASDELLALLLRAAERADTLVSDDGWADLLNRARLVPRARAVLGLIVFAARSKDERAISAVEKLSGDNEPSARYEAAWHLSLLSRIPQERAWPIASRLVSDENAIVAGMAVHRLGPFFGMDSERALKLSAEALQRFEGATDLERGRADALFQVAWYHLTGRSEVATAAIDSAINDISRTTAGVEELLHAYRRWLTVGDEGDSEEAATRRRTQELFDRVARASIASLDAAAHGSTKVNERNRSERPPQANLVDAVATQLYFASGAFDDKRGDIEHVSNASRFFAETRELLLQVGSAGVASAADRVLETLQYLLDRVAPEQEADVRHRFVQVAESAIRSGLGEQYWTLDPIEDVLRRLIAGGPSRFDDEMLGGWDRILDALLERGWRQAYLLARDFDLSL